MTTIGRVVILSGFVSGLAYAQGPLMVTDGEAPTPTGSAVPRRERT